MIQEPIHPLTAGENYHVYTKSIAGFEIFQHNSDYLRMLQLIRFFQYNHHAYRFSKYLELKEVQTFGFHKVFSHHFADHKKNIQIIAYCLMPTHLHLILSPHSNRAIAKFMNDILNSYTRYFNLVHNRKGPLWQSRYKWVHVTKDEQLLHLTRYLHLNPVTARLVNHPGDWPASSYLEYLYHENIPVEDAICEFKDVLKIEPKRYQSFVENRISAQRELAKIKKVIFAEKKGHRRGGRQRWARPEADGLKGGRSRSSSGLKMRKHSPKHLPNGSTI
ncbi:MAG: transposase [Candidatus Omnitrophica bacterium]|nr:transposase [Candidatus Omnitrophota bacterium]